MTVTTNVNAASDDIKSSKETAAEEKSKIDKEIEQAEKEKKLALLRKETAVAEKDRNKATLPSTTNKGLDGVVKINSGAGYYAEILAYKALDALAHKIGHEINDEVNGKKVILTDNFELSKQDALWKVIHLAIADSTREIDKLKEEFGDGLSENLGLKTQLESVGASMTAASAILGSVADIAKFFRTDREITSRVVKLTNRSLIASLAMELQSDKTSAQVILPEMQLHRSGLLFESTQQLMGKRRKAATARENIRLQSEPIIEKLVSSRREKEKLEKEIVKLKKEEKDATSEERKLQDLFLKIASHEKYERTWKQVDARYSAALEAASTLLEALTNSSEKGVSPLESVATIDLLKKNDNAMVLYVEIASQGAEVETIKRVFGRPVIAYLGGVVVNYFLFDKEGDLKASGVESVVKTASVKNEVTLNKLEGL